MKKLFLTFTALFILSLSIFGQTYNDATLAQVREQDKISRDLNGKLQTLSAVEHAYRADVYSSNRVFANAREHFQKIIANEITRIIEKTKTHFRIDITVDDSLKQLIYQNGVFPAQGVRPVFSSVIDILEANLSKLLFDALIARSRKISIAYDYLAHEIKARVGAKRDVVIKYVGRIDKIRDSNLADLISNVSVHESGHAVAYAVLFGLAALQLKSKVASTYVSGFTFPHQIYQTRKSLLDKIKVYLAGGLAEEIIFGKDRATVGRENDREEATKLR